MALSQPRSIFGVHSVTPYSRTNGMFYGTLKVLKSSSLSLQGELIELMGGSSKYSWAAEDGQIKAEMSLKFSEYADFLFELFLGKAVTANAAETTGSITTLTNKYGSSIKATTGIASVAILSGSEADLKYGHYVIQAATTTTVHVYYFPDGDIGAGTNGSYSTDTGRITSSALTVVQSTATNIPNFGIKFTGDSGTIGITAGDTATFSVRPVNTGSTEVNIGSSADSVFPEFGCLVLAQKRGNGELTELDCYRCKSAGMPIGFEMSAWSEADVKVKVLYDSTLDGIFKFTHVKRSTVT